jgi:hypothetical protein
MVPSKPFTTAENRSGPQKVTIDAVAFDIICYHKVSEGQMQSTVERFWIIVWQCMGSIYIDIIDC